MKKFLFAMALALSLISCECTAQETPPIPSSAGQVEQIDLSELLAGLGGPRPLPIIPGQRGPSSILLERIIDSEAAASLDASLQKLAGERPKEIRIVIDSQGGDTRSGMAIVKMIERYPAKVTCVVDGDASSMALVILQSCDRREMTPRSTLMAHEVMMVVDGRMTAEELRANASSTEATNNQAMQMTFAKSKVKPADGLAKIRANGGQWWMNSAEALAVGLVDAVVPKVVW